MRIVISLVSICLGILLLIFLSLVILIFIIVFSPLTIIYPQYVLKIPLIVLSAIIMANFLPQIIDCWEKFYSNLIELNRLPTQVGVPEKKKN